MKNDGLVTVDFTNAPLSKVIKSMEWQIGKKIITNADPNLPITIHFKRMPTIEAVNALAIKVGGFARMAYLGAPDGPTLLKGIAAFKTGPTPAGWKVFFSYGGFGGPLGGIGQSGDPRLLKWRLSDPGDHSLQAYLNEAAQKTGVTFAVPENWNPVLAGPLPAEGTTRDLSSAIIVAAGGWKVRVFLLTLRPPHPERGEGNEGRIFPPPGQPEVNPDWVAERLQSQIAQLPEKEQPQMQKMADEMRAMWSAAKGLSPEDRRAKMAEYFSRPDVQEAMDERMAARDAMSTPAQREERYRNYIQRKQSLKNQPPQNQ